MTGPRLLFRANRPVKQSEIGGFHAALDLVHDPDAKSVVFPDWVDIYQLVDGLWRPLDPGVTPAPAEVLERDGVTTEG